MRIVDRGQGLPVLFIPGVQGRWEYMRPTVDALAESCRVITFSLADEPSAEYPLDPKQGLGGFVRQVDAALDQTGVGRAAICGVSFGGLVALHFVAAHRARSTSLILASTPGPGWRLRPTHAVYARAPWLFAPIFFAAMPRRLRAELHSAFPTRRERRRFTWDQVRTFLTAPVNPSRMAARARLIASARVAEACASVAVPTLIVTGDPALDHVVHGDSPSAYQALIPGARVATLECTGHLGCVTRPKAFAELVTAFANEHRHAAA
jgi:pimeloyl-ACP methyl ester carboxylesterase